MHGGRPARRAGGGAFELAAGFKKVYIGLPFRAATKKAPLRVSMRDLKV